MNEEQKVALAADAVLGRRQPPSIRFDFRCPHCGDAAMEAIGFVKADVLYTAIAAYNEEPHSYFCKPRIMIVRVTRRRALRTILGQWLRSFAVLIAGDRS